MSKPGLSLETGASVILRDFINQHMAQFAWVLQADMLASRAVVATYIDGLAGAAALAIQGGLGSREEVIALTEKTLREAIERDLQHLARGRH
jgi:hypothetical protein